MYVYFSSECNDQKARSGINYQFHYSVGKTQYIYVTHMYLYDIITRVINVYDVGTISCQLDAIEERCFSMEGKENGK